MSGPSIDNDAFFQDLPPLPAGWDWKRCGSVQPAEWNALPDAQQSLIRAHRHARVAQWREICGADDAAAYRRHRLEVRRAILPSMPGTTEQCFLAADELAVVERYRVPREQVGTPLFEIAEVMHREKCEYWGFVAFQVCGYGSAAAQARWREFVERFGKMINDRLASLAVDGIKSTGLRDEDEGFTARFKEMWEAAMTSGILPLFQLVFRDHEIMSGMGPQDVRGAFREMLKLDEEEDESMPDRVPIGVDARLCLMADEGVVSSLLDERDGRRPYIIGVLSDIDDEEITDDHEAVHFKIALESVVDLWRQIQVQAPITLVPPEGKIYISPGVFEDDD